MLFSASGLILSLPGIEELSLGRFAGERYQSPFIIRNTMQTLTQCLCCQLSYAPSTPALYILLLGEDCRL